jgi:hypothetical protein
MRFAPVVLVALGAFALPGTANEQLVGSWYPILQPGNAWVYAEESRDADGDHGIDDPTVGRWTTTETVESVDEIPEGTRVVIRSVITDLVKTNGWTDNTALITPAVAELLVRGNCVYRLSTSTVEYDDDIWSAYDANHNMRARFRRALLGGQEPAALCFPMTAGGEWGRVRSTSPAEEDVWKVRALNGDPFGAPGGRTFHVEGHEGSGSTIDMWFQEGVGVVQLVDEHHGTYDRHHRMLVNAALGGVTRTLNLQPARTTPLDPGECRDDWRHWIRADGTLIPDLLSCIVYARTKNPEPST